jgi:hypothetical protein
MIIFLMTENYPKKDPTRTMQEIVIYNSIQFGVLLQNSNNDKIVCISWSECENGDSCSPEFIFFPSLEEIIRYIFKLYTHPFVLANMSQDIYIQKKIVFWFLTMKTKHYE